MLGQKFEGSCGINGVVQGLVVSGAGLDWKQAKGIGAIWKLHRPHRIVHLSASPP